MLVLGPGGSCVLVLGWWEGMAIQRGTRPRCRRRGRKEAAVATPHLVCAAPASVAGASPEFTHLLSRLLDKNPATRIKWQVGPRREASSAVVAWPSTGTASCRAP